MNELIHWFEQHQVLATYVAAMILTAFGSSLPAPTKDSSQQYIFWFKFANTIIGNFMRAQSTALEKSPNWEAAVQKHIAENPPPNLSRVQP